MTVGSKISLNCTARGNPVPYYHWQFPNFTQVWYRSLNHPILTPSSKFPGVYICTASNSQGTVTKYFIITKAPRKFLAVLCLFKSLFWDLRLILCKKLSHLSQEIKQSSQQQSDYLWPLDSCSSLLFQFLRHTEAYFHARKATISKDNLPHQYQYKTNLNGCMLVLKLQLKKCTILSAIAKAPLIKRLLSKQTNLIQQKCV